MVGWALRVGRDGNLAGGVGMLVKGGGNIPFQEGHNASSDRLLLSGVLHSHKGLERCGRLLSVLESKAGEGGDDDTTATKKKSARR